MAVGDITFGCLNNFCKVTPFTLNLWSEILRRLPDSRLLLHSHEGAHRDRFRKSLEAMGIAPNRISLAGYEPPETYLRRYQQIDIALDPFPYGGGTTTCDSLFMGIPVISLAGPTAVSRAGLSILSNLGLPELVAPDPDSPDAGSPEAGSSEVGSSEVGSDSVGSDSVGLDSAGSGFTDSARIDAAVGSTGWAGELWGVSSAPLADWAAGSGSTVIAPGCGGCTRISDHRASPPRQSG